MQLFAYTLDMFSVVVIIATFTVLGFLSRLYSFVVSHFGAFRLEEILRTNLSAHLAIIPLGYIISNGSGALKKVMLTDVKNLHAFVADSVPMIAKSVFVELSEVDMAFI
jgi:ATP-binding cassette subfamily B protein